VWAVGNARSAACFGQITRAVAPEREQFLFSSQSSTIMSLAGMTGLSSSAIAKQAGTLSGMDVEAARQRSVMSINCANFMCPLNSASYSHSS
jgi:hypothetical protein